MKDSSGNKGETPEWNWEFALKTAILVGLSTEQFDQMTPYELSLCIEGYTEIRDTELKERLTLVWLGEYYHRTKRLPNLQSELKKISSEEKRVMTDEEMLEVAKVLNAQFGGIYKQGGE